MTMSRKIQMSGVEKGDGAKSSGNGCLLKILSLTMWMRSIFTSKIIHFCAGIKHCSTSAGERTLVAVKPDGVQRGLVGEIIGRFERRGYKLCAIRVTVPTKDQLDLHYCDSVDAEYYPKILEQMKMGPMVAMVWEGLNVVKNARKMIGPTHPEDCSPGTIRGDLAQFKRRNVVHGSDSVLSAEREMRIWFREEEIISWVKSDSHLLIEQQNQPKQ